jgi:hypothetical protein
LPRRFIATIFSLPTAASVHVATLGTVGIV